MATSQEWESVVKALFLQIGDKAELELNPEKRTFSVTKTNHIDIPQTDQLLQLLIEKYPAIFGHIKEGDLQTTLNDHNGDDKRDFRYTQKADGLQVFYYYPDTGVITPYALEAYMTGIGESGFLLRAMHLRYAPVLDDMVKPDFPDPIKALLAAEYELMGGTEKYTSESHRDIIVNTPDGSERAQLHTLRFEDEGPKVTLYLGKQGVLKARQAIRTGDC